MQDQASYPPTDPWRAGLRGRCPRCGQGRLFRGFLKLAERCDVCGLDYSFADPADGPAFFVMVFACIPAISFAAWAEIVHEPSMWFHIFVSLPLVLLTCIPPLRPLKGLFVASQFHHKAEEGKPIRHDG